MAGAIEVTVPDIGDFTDIPVIEVLVKPGDTVKKDDSLITLESEKASMEVPSSGEGVVQDVKVKVGDKVSKGSVIVTLASDTAAPGPAATQAATPQARQAPQAAAASQPASNGKSSLVELAVPDIGDFTDIPVIEVLIKAGDMIAKEDLIVVLESEKLRWKFRPPQAVSCRMCASNPATA